MNVTVTRYANGEPPQDGDEGTEAMAAQPCPEEDHLADEHGLRRVTAYVHDRRRTKGGSAVRVARHREKRKEAGEVQMWLPAADAHRIREAGGLDALLAQQATGERPRTWRSLAKRVGFVVWALVSIPCIGLVVMATAKDVGLM